MYAGLPHLFVLLDPYRHHRYPRHPGWRKVYHRSIFLCAPFHSFMLSNLQLKCNSTDVYIGFMNKHHRQQHPLHVLLSSDSLSPNSDQ